MSLLDHIVAHAVSHPERLSLKDQHRALSYGQLLQEVRATAAGLSQRGIVAGDRVAIQMSTSVDAVVCALACLSVGAIFVPMSTVDPAARTRRILDDCAPAVVVQGTYPPDDARYGGRPVVRPADLRSSAMVEHEPLSGERPAYCIYTSGTTGVPKGVLVGLASLWHAVEDTIAALGIGSCTRALSISSFHFDGSFGLLFPVPAGGGLLVINRQEPVLLPRRFINTVLTERINLAFCSPSYLRLLLACPDLSLLRSSSLKTIGLGGEALSAATVLAIHDALPQVCLFNRYGPTETTIAVTSHRVDPLLVKLHEPVPIGYPHPGVTFHLVDEEGRLFDEVDRGGELYIGGDQLMEGYWRDPGLSAKVLRRDLVPGRVLYRTGDLVARRPGGEYVYLGRVDRVIKRNGVRISLDEIELVLRSQPGVRHAACVAVEGDDDAVKIVAFVTADSPLQPSSVSAGLVALLPRAMLPDALQQVDAMPLTASGKVDYRLLESHWRARDAGSARN